MNAEATEFIDLTKKRSQDLGNFLEGICNADFAFAASHPLAQTMINRQSLWKLALLEEQHEWIDLDYKVDFVRTIFAIWRENVKGYKDFYKTTGFLFYLFEDSHATLNVTVVANTPEGNPYPFLKLVPDIRKVLVINGGKTLIKEKTDHFDANEEIKVLKIIEKNKGSIGKPSASQLKMKVGELRTLILKMDIGHSVNEIRKKYNKRPADLYIHDEIQMPPERVGWEGVVPPGF